MTAAEKLVLLKKDLQMMTSSNDDYLENLLAMAEKAMPREGIQMDGGIECDMTQVQYAAYLFRKRGAADTAMPRYLRYQLNNILFGQKGKSNDV